MGGSLVMELFAAGCESSKLSMFQKAIKHIVEGKITSMMRCSYCLCLRIPCGQGEGWDVRGCVYSPSYSLPFCKGKMLSSAPCCGCCPPLLIIGGAVMGGVPSCLLGWMRTLTLLLQPGEALCWVILFPEEPSSLPAVQCGISMIVSFPPLKGEFHWRLIINIHRRQHKGFFNFLQDSFIFLFFL